MHQPTAVELFFSPTPSTRHLDWCDISRRHSVFLHFPTEFSLDSRQSSTPLPGSTSSPLRVFCNALKSLCTHFLLRLQGKYVTFWAGTRDQLSVCYITNARDAFAATGIHKKWLAGHVTNFDYIMALNTFSGRSLNDLRQYPVRANMARLRARFRNTCYASLHNPIPMQHMF
jgi:hypothetical protein